MSGAVDAGCFVEFGREAAHELDHEEDEERIRGKELADQQRHVGIHQAKLLEHDVLRNDHHVERQEQGGDHHAEEQASAGGS